MGVPEISVQDLEVLRNESADFLLLDVRNQDEYDICNLGGRLLPLSELAASFQQLDREQQIIVHCHSGGRSKRAVEFLLQQNFKRVFNLRGGITAWANEIDHEMTKY